MRLTRLLLLPLSRKSAQKLEQYGRFNPQPITLQTYLDVGREGTAESSYKFLQKELLVRLANIMKEIDLLPRKLLNMPSAAEVRNMYRKSFEELLPFESAEPTSDNIDSFNEILEGILERHEDVVEKMAQGIIQLRQRHGINITSDNSIQYFLDRLYLSRISIRMLQYQHLVVFGMMLPESPRHVGCIDPACDVQAVIIDAYDSARFLCDGCYCDAPKLKFDSYNSITPGLPIAIAAVPSHLYHIMFELFKNSMRATVDRYGEFSKLPPVEILATLGEEDMTVRLSDSGGGISRRVMDQLFRYTYSTAPPPDSTGHNAALAGYGYGLPLSRLYARYFHGDLTVISMEGYGTEAFLHVKAIPFKASEIIPVYSTSSQRNLTMGRKGQEWTKAATEEKEKDDGK